MQIPPKLFFDLVVESGLRRSQDLGPPGDVAMSIVYGAGKFVFSPHHCGDKVAQARRMFGTALRRPGPTLTVTVTYQDMSMSIQWPLHKAIL